LEGLTRDSIINFHKLSVSVKIRTSNEELFEFQTKHLLISISLKTACVSYFEIDEHGNQILLARDISRGSLCYSSPNLIEFTHYMQRNSNEHYYGFGDKTGAFDKHGQRLIMVRKCLFCFFFFKENKLKKILNQHLFFKTMIEKCGRISL